LAPQVECRAKPPKILFWKKNGNFFMLSQGKKREKEEKKGRKRREEREEKKRERKERREERKERKKERRKKKEREKEEEKKEGKERRKDKTLVTKNLFGGSNVECDIFLKKFMPK
jgi:hypothetical protein